MSIANRLERIEARRGNRTSTRDRQLQELTWKMLQYFRGEILDRPETPEGLFPRGPTVGAAQDLLPSIRRDEPIQALTDVPEDAAPVEKSPVPAVDRLKPYRQDSGVSLADYL